MPRWWLPRTWRPMGRHQRQFMNRQELHEPGGCPACDGEGGIWVAELENDPPAWVPCPNGCPEPDPF